MLTGGSDGKIAFFFGAKWPKTKVAVRRSKKGDKAKLVDIECEGR